MDGLGPHFLLASSLKTVVLGIAVVQDVLKVLFESELGVESNSQKFHLRIDFKCLATQF